MTLSLDLLQTIQNRTADSFSKLVSIRRDLHQHPERSGEEAWTAAYLMNELHTLNLPVRTFLDGYGLVADLITDPAKPTVALRVDMDALPIHEVNQISYRSQVPGVMHACGHDVHSAIGIGTAKVLSQMASDLPGNVRFIFQPEEEEITGALSMLQSGALSNPTPKAIFGLHVAPLPVGQVGWTDDLFLAGFDHYLAALIPKKGITLSLEVLDTIAQRCCDAILDLNTWHLPLAWETMHAFWQEMQAGPKDLRRFMIFDASVDEEEESPWHGQFGVGITAAAPYLRRAALRKVNTALKKIGKEAKVNLVIEHMGTMPDMRNDPTLVRTALPALEAALGEDHLLQLKAAFPFNCEDFAYYTKYIPGAMFWLGAANPAEKKVAMLHTPDFDVDERCLTTGTVAMTALLIKTLLSYLT